MASAAAAAAVHRTRPRAAHPESLDACLFVGGAVPPALCCSVCFEPFKQARACPSPAA